MVELLVEIPQEFTPAQANLVFSNGQQNLPQTEYFTDFETSRLVFASLSAVSIYISCYSLKVWKSSEDG